MFLKRITLCGFKSFCDRVDFELGPGITCIVGPNGCGKSNVVDSVKWVLGEQSARSLRGRQMIDMIFNGSSTRRSSGVAQVDLVFDNSDRSLALDQTEVTVTRKLYRSGDSEYLLNQQTSRLKDIRELFLDTGVGLDAYSIIEQGKVDSLLQSSPTDRRVIFDEAAGISRYKARRREAERKLERTQENLLRVGDIIDEMEKRLRSVKLQAGKARSFKEYEARLHELRSSFALAEFHRHTLETTRLTHEVQDRSDQATALRTEIDRQEMEGAQVTSRLDRLAENITAADGRLADAKSSLAAQEERIAAARRRAEEQAVLELRAEERLLTDGTRTEEARSELAGMEKSVDELRKQADDLQHQAEQLLEQDRSLARDLTHAQAILEDEKAGIIDLVRRSAQTHNEIVRLDTFREALVDQQGRLSARGAQITSELENQLQHKVEISRRLRELEQLTADELHALDEKKADAARVYSLTRKLIEELAAAREYRSAMQSRRELLADLEARMEGVGAGARSLLVDGRAGVVADMDSPVVGLVADVFQTDIKNAPIIEAALGEWDQFLVISDSRRFLGMMGSLGELPGRLTALCLDLLPPVVNDRAFVDRPGFLGRALDLVRFPEAYDVLAKHLLGKTLVVESMDAALKFASEDVAGHRFVTPRGELIESDGRISLGPPTSAAGLISRKSELRDLEVQLTANAELIDKLTDQLNRSEAQGTHLEAVQQELRSAIEKSNTARVEANAAHQRVVEVIERLAAEQPLIANEAQLLEHQIEGVLEQSEAGGRSLAALEQENKEKERRILSHEDQLDGVVAARRQVQEQQTQARVLAGQLAEKRTATDERIRVIRRTISELEATAAAARQDRDACRARMSEAEQAVASGQAQVSLLTGMIHDLDIAASRLRQERDALRLKMDERAQSIKSARSRLEAVEIDLHEHQMSLAETNVRREELVSRVLSELSIDLAQRYPGYQPQEQDWAQIELDITELRGKMERLGNINLDAIHELEELETRHQFLTAQRDDLNDSQRQLEQLIGRLNLESQDRFKTTFDLIREHFRALFRKLFGGGRADILLEDPDNILESGIEIVAQPPGKELQIISLMSGGEKSMTAIALLMSIFKARPAPFAIMDEVDAALDEANNDRFNRIVREFISESQFIIVTHSRWTMNIADHLYGITMQEPGVSTRVSVQLGNVEVA